jgi:formylglycine-generating enzyme
MTTAKYLRLEQIEYRVCDIAAEQLGFERAKVSPSDRLIEDLHCDSLDLVELLMEMEEVFLVTLPNEAPNSVYKAVFLRSPFRLADLAELIYLQQGTAAPVRKEWRRERDRPAQGSATPFTQLGGRWQPAESQCTRILEAASTGDDAQFRRTTDGMRCIRIPAAEVEIGSEAEDSFPDEHPLHVVSIDSFLIDAEPVSTTAYCRFLNSVDGVISQNLADWFLLDPCDDRGEHMLVVRTESGWEPIAGAERWPMILVSWYGANAYSLWANRSNWREYRAESNAEYGSFLPTEAQWEYAARGARQRAFPSGNQVARAHELRFGQHRQAATYTVNELPLAPVNEQLGMSPFGLHHMAGNVWQWCRDWYDPTFYHTAQASSRNPCNRHHTGIRSERGGSWVGPAQLCRSSHRRGRNPLARGRCLGFRCITAATSL